MVAWSTFVAPKAAVAVADPVRLLVILRRRRAGAPGHAADAVVWVFAGLFAVQVTLFYGFGAG
jgi:hypothetical protein